MSRKDHAIVIGGGIAGLLAARVLSGCFGTVTLIEKDGLPASPEPRKGVPQGHHVHGLLARGQQILADLFPDLVPELIAGGATVADMGRDFRWHHHGVWKARFDSGIAVTLFTRPFLEWQIARRVQALANVEVVRGCAERLLADRERTRIVGVELREPHGARRVESDLVLDASGRGSRTPQWLEALGYRRPEESTVRVDVTYASRLYRAEACEWQGLLLSPLAPSRRAGVAFAVEGRRLLVTLGGLHGECPPHDDAGYLAYAASLPEPDLHRAIAEAEPLTPVALHRFSTNLRRHYERLPAFPEGLLVMGDAVCSFNPIYGQGMSVSALEAAALGVVLGEGMHGLPARFHRAVACIVDMPWRLTTGEDFRYPEAVGRRPPLTPLLHWYTGRLHRRCAHDGTLAQAFYRVMHMIDPPSAIFRPSIVARVIGGRRRSYGHDAVSSGTTAPA